MVLVVIFIYVPSTPILCVSKLKVFSESADFLYGPSLVPYGISTTSQLTHNQELIFEIHRKMCFI